MTLILPVDSENKPARRINSVWFGMLLACFCHIAWVAIWQGIYSFNRPADYPFSYPPAVRFLVVFQLLYIAPLVALFGATRRWLNLVGVAVSGIVGISVTGFFYAFNLY